MDDLEVILLEERLPDGWESRILAPMGLTILTFNLTVLRVERGTDEEKFIADRKAALEANGSKDPAETAAAAETLS